MDRVERLTNLLALLLETPRPLTLVEIAGEMEGQYPTGEADTASGVRTGQGRARDSACRSRPKRSPAIGPASRDTASIGPAMNSPISTSRRTSRRALQLALAAVRSSSGRRSRRASRRSGSSAADGSTLARPSPPNVPELPALPTLRHAAARRAVVAFHVPSTSAARRSRRTDVARRLLDALGRDHGHDELRTYRVDRIYGDVQIVGGRRRLSASRSGSIHGSCCRPTPKNFGVAGGQAGHRPRSHRTGSGLRSSSGRSAATGLSPGGATGRSRSVCRPVTLMRSRRGRSVWPSTPRCCRRRSSAASFVARLEALVSRRPRRRSKR